MTREAQLTRAERLQIARWLRNAAKEAKAAQTLLARYAPPTGRSPSPDWQSAQRLMLCVHTMKAIEKEQRPT